MPRVLLGVIVLVALLGCVGKKAEISKVPAKDNTAVVTDTVKVDTIKKVDNLLKK